MTEEQRVGTGIETTTPTTMMMMTTTLFGSNSCLTQLQLDDD